MIYHRWSPTLGSLEDTAENVWGTTEYEGDRDDPTVFVGLYGLPDFYALWRHRGKKWIFWCGSDITHFINGYWLEEGGTIKIDSKPLAEWINKNCESWVENEVEYEALKELGIESQICPSFLGDVTKFEISYQWSDRPKLYTSVSGDDFSLYKWREIMDLTLKYPNYEFHFFGNIIDYPYVKTSNAFIHGKIPKEQMNEEIKNMQGAIRLLPFEGFSEIIAKSILMAQWPISEIKYPHVLSIEELKILKDKKEPNIAGRSYFLQNLNNFPWNLKK